MVGFVGAALGIPWSFHCGGTVDDGYDGLSKGGDLDALDPPNTPPGSRCAGYDAAAWFSNPPCSSAGQASCEDSGVTPAGWPGASCEPTYPDAGLTCQGEDDMFGGTSISKLFCVPGAEGDAFCRAWALQYVIDGTDVDVQCYGEHTGAPYCTFTSSQCYQNLAAPCSDMCVVRNGVPRCETPCEAPP
jgi:hypothetical protein